MEIQGVFVNPKTVEIIDQIEPYEGNHNVAKFTFRVQFVSGNNRIFLFEHEENAKLMRELLGDGLC